MRDEGPAPVREDRSARDGALEEGTLGDGASADRRVVAWYEQKTEFLLEKYAASERVHYHTGLVPPAEQPASDRTELKQQIWRSQEAMLERAARVWDAERHLRGDVLDVGCGLGGGPIFWAQRYGASVTALTPVPGHLPIIAACAEQGGVGDRVRPLLGDAHTVPGERAYDAAVATGASNYFDRRRWFARLAGLLRPNGRVFIEDTFVGRSEMSAPFNDYWISNIGARREYIEAAESSGFTLVHEEDVTGEAAGFWRLSVAYSQHLLGAGGLDVQEIEERQRSIAWQDRVYGAYLDGGFFNLLLHFQRTGA